MSMQTDPQSMDIARAFMSSHHATQPLLRQSVAASNGGAIPALPNTPGEMSSFAKTPAGQALVNRIMEQIHKSAASQSAARAKKFDKLGSQSSGGK